jgi:hypothetical protein
MFMKKYDVEVHDEGCACYTQSPEHEKRENDGPTGFVGVDNPTTPNLRRSQLVGLVLDNAASSELTRTALVISTAAFSMLIFSKESLAFSMKL